MESRAWIEIDLEAIRANLRLIRTLTGARIIAVLKANAYGLGAVPVARAIAGLVDSIAVAVPGEAIELQEAGIDKPILVLGPVFPGEIPELTRRRLRLTVGSREMLELLLAKKSAVPALVHLKVDTGLGRLGFLPGQLASVATMLAGQRQVVIEGVFSHFSTPGGDDDDYAREQIGRFRRAVALLRRSGGQFVAHMASSAAITRFSDCCFDLVRPGSLLYGFNYPGIGASWRENLQPAFALKTRVVSLREVPRGTSVSYGRNYITGRRSKLAVVPFGFADGFDDRLVDRGRVLWHGQELPVAGTICMDMAMLDVTGHDVRLGDTITVIGIDGGRVACLPSPESPGGGRLRIVLLTGLDRQRIEKIYTG